MMTLLSIQSSSSVKKIGRTTKWMKENFDPKFDAAAKQEELRKFEKLYVYVIVIEFDAKAIKIGTKVVVTKKA